MVSFPQVSASECKDIHHIKALALLSKSFPLCYSPAILHLYYRSTRTVLANNKIYSCPCAWHESIWGEQRYRTTHSLSPHYMEMMVSFTSQPLNSREKHPLIRMLDGPHSRSRRNGHETHLTSLRWIQPCIVQSLPHSLHRLRKLASPSSLQCHLKNKNKHGLN
jgi:hypothetical protein